MPILGYVYHITRLSCVIIFIITRKLFILCDYKNNHTKFQYFLKYCVIIFIITQDEQFSYDYLYNHTGWSPWVISCDYFLGILENFHFVWFELSLGVIINDASCREIMKLTTHNFVYDIYNHTTRWRNFLRKFLARRVIINIVHEIMCR